MKKSLLILFLLFCSIANACDVCGCQLGGLYFGIMPHFNSHYVGIRYSQARFNASIMYNNDLLEDEFSNDLFTKTEILGRISLSKRVQLNATIPYIYNTMEGSHQTLAFSGIGDPSVLLYFNPLTKSTSNEMITFSKGTKWQHSLLLGGGVKLPLGKFNRLDQGEVVNRNFQVGSGSTDFILSANYTATYNKYGLNVESAYKINTENSEGYQFGNQYNVMGNIFYWITTPEVSIIPMAGVIYEQGETHLDNEILQVNTGGNATLGSVGVQLFRNQFAFAASFQTPISQNYNSDAISNITSKNRLSIGVTYNFTVRTKGMIPIIPVE